MELISNAEQADEGAGERVALYVDAELISPQLCVCFGAVCPKKQTMGASPTKASSYDNIEYLDKLRAPDQSCFVTKVNPHLQFIKVECGRNGQEVREEWLVSLGRYKSMSRWNLDWKERGGGMDRRDDTYFEDTGSQRFMHMPLDQFLYQQDQFWRKA